MKASFSAKSCPLNRGIFRVFAMPSRPNFRLAVVLAALPLLHVSSAHAAERENVQLAALFGESDEEKAARQQHEDNQDLATQALSQRVRDLEDSLRQLTGQNEVLAHRVQELNDKLDRQQKDFEYRLCVMSAQQLGSSPGQGSETALPCNPSGGPAQGAPPADGQSSRGTQLGRPPGSLGTLSSNDATALPPPAQTTRTQFQVGMNLLAKAQYDEARAAFRNFADSAPKDPDASLAIYWIGRIAYVQKDYAGAARAFAEVIKKYGGSSSAPESLLKLGQSLLGAGEKKEGCTALVALKKRYPGAAKSLVEQAASAHKAACKH
jgi:tol-pal system protein YbgF